MPTVNMSLRKEIIRRLVDEFDPEAIYLFGSYAWGKPGEDSDLDLLVIVRESQQAPVQCAVRAYRSLRGLKVPIDTWLKRAPNSIGIVLSTLPSKRKLLKKASSCMEAKLDLVKNWLTIARRDLDSAERLAAGPHSLRNGLSLPRRKACSRVAGVQSSLSLRLKPLYLRTFLVTFGIPADGLKWFTSDEN